MKLNTQDQLTEQINVLTKPRSKGGLTVGNTVQTHNKEIVATPKRKQLKDQIGNTL